MAQVSYRANLSAAAFPFLSENQGRSVIIKAYDNTYAAAIASKEDADKDAGIPQIYYCHNVMPTAQGFQSVGYLPTALALSPTEDKFVETFLLRDSAENKAYFAYTSDGRNFILLAGTNTWLATTTIPGTAGKQVTVAHVNGISYIYFSGVGCYYYDFGANVLTAVTLTGLTPANIKGIITSSGYLLAWTETEIAWSSTIDPTDFVPSLTTGAGGGAVQDAKGKIVCCVTSSSGFIVYTTGNAVNSIYSGNARFPFTFKELKSSGGLTSPDLVSADSNIGSHYVYTTSGLQVVLPNQVQIFLPELTDFISGYLFEDFNEASQLMTSTELVSPMKKRVSVVSDRYLIISYGILELTHAIVYDLAQKRLGKLKVTHVDCFELFTLDASAVDIPKRNIGFLRKDGSVFTVDFSVGAPTSSGVMILGKFQYSRSRLTTLETVVVENVKEFSIFSLLTRYTDSKQVEHNKVGTLLASENKTREYGFHSAGINHSLVFLGAFNVTSVVLNLHIHGRR